MEEIAACLAIAAVAVFSSGRAGAATVNSVADSGEFHVMDVNEVSFHAETTYANAHMDVDLWVDLNEPDGLSYRIPAFWDGGQVFGVRLVATKPGVWAISPSIIFNSMRSSWSNIPNGRRIKTRGVSFGRKYQKAAI